MKFKLLYKLVSINTFVVVVLVLGIGFWSRHYASLLIEQNRMMAYQNFLMFRDATEQYLIYTSLIVIPVVVLLNWMLIRAIVRPLDKMRRLTEKVAKGEYHVQVDVDSNDEIGELAHSFNQMSGELDRIEKLRRTLVSDVAHELRTPLSTIRGYIEAIRDGILPASSELLSRVYNEVERLVRLVEDLHRLSLFERELTIRRPESPINVRIVTNQIVSMFLPEWTEKSITFYTDIPEKLPKIWIDQAHLTQVLVNLFDNTVRYTPENESVHLTVQEDKGILRFRLTNTGVEISKESLPLIFERFYRVDESRSRTQGGTGIGLAIVRDIVTQYDGTIWATSGNYSTTIHVDLPLFNT